MTTARASSVDIIYGDYHSSKTSRLGDVAEYYYEKTGKPARLISSDTGGWDVIQDLINEGIIVPFKLTIHRPHLIQDMKWLTQGRWPLDPTDYLSELETEPHLEGVSVLLLDGITSMCDMLLEYHVHSIKIEGASVVPQGVKIAGLGKDNFIQDGEYMRRIKSLTDFGEVQTTAREMIRNTSFLPIPAVWTALECKGEDNDDKPVHGPQFIGKALTGTCGQLFANMVHLDLIPVQIKDKNGAVVGEEFRPRMYLKSHYDPRDPLKLRYPAQVRAPRTMWDKVPLYLPEPNMKLLYKALEELREESQKQIQAAKAVEV